MDKQLGVLLGKISLYVYDFDPTQLADLGKPDVAPLHDSAAIPTSYAGILRYLDKTVLAFQGTITDMSVNAVKDWLQNFRVGRIRAMGLPGTVHIGFINQLRLLWDDLLQEFASGLVRPFYVTGHSQGGAIAALATKALEQAGYAPDATYTFASPRPGDAAFAQSVTTPVYRVEFGDDVVPHVPFKRPQFGELADTLAAEFERKLVAAQPELQLLVDTVAEGYQAVGALTYGRSPADLTISMSPGDEAALASKRLLHFLVAGQHLFSDHHMTNYISLLS